MNQERLKQLAIGYRDPLYTLALFLGCICLLAVTIVVITASFYLIPAIRDWQHANTATTKLYEQGIGEGVGSVKEAAENIKAASAEAIPTLKGIQAVESEAQGYISDLRVQTQTLTTGVDARLQTLDSVLVSLRGVSEEARTQVKQNGDATARVVGTLDLSIKDLTAHTTKVLDDGSLVIETANPKLQTALEHLDSVIIDADGTIKAYKPAGVNLAGITDDFHSMTTDSKNKLHEILYPAAKHGWARVGQIATYILRPAFDGARLYYVLTSLPVRITQPIPIGKP